MPTTSPTASSTAIRVAGLLDIGARAAFGLVLAGVILMLLTGVQPLAQPTAPPTPGSWFASLLGLDPEAFIWLGIGLTTILPALTVLAAGIGFARAGDRRGAKTAALVLVALAVALVVAIGTH
jgi:uncharacterized membrane protein